MSDDAEVRRITKTGKVVLQRLGVLTTVTDMKQLVPAFKVKNQKIASIVNYTVFCIDPNYFVG